MADDELMTAEEFAALVRRPLKTVYQWNYTGDAPPRIKLGRTVLYRRRDVEKWLTEHYAAEPA